MELPLGAIGDPRVQLLLEVVPTRISKDIYSHVSFQRGVGSGSPVPPLDPLMSVSLTWLQYFCSFSLDEAHMTVNKRQIMLA